MRADQFLWRISRRLDVAPFDRCCRGTVAMVIIIVMATSLRIVRSYKRVCLSCYSATFGFLGQLLVLYMITLGLP